MYSYELYIKLKTNKKNHLACTFIYCSLPLGGAIFLKYCDLRFQESSAMTEQQIPELSLIKINDPNSPQLWDLRPGEAEWRLTVLTQLCSSSRWPWLRLESERFIGMSGRRPPQSTSKHMVTQKNSITGGKFVAPWRKSLLLLLRGADAPQSHPQWLTSARAEKGRKEVSAITRIRRQNATEGSLAEIAFARWFGDKGNI